MVNHPNRNRARRTEVDGVRFKLSRDATGNPHMLKQWQQDPTGRWHWATVWAAWRQDSLTGAIAVAFYQLAGPASHGSRMSRLSGSDH
jgi:hypothetical protein